MNLAPQINAQPAAAETIRLEDGGRFFLRAVLPSDKARFLRAFERLSSLSRYRRFLASKRRLSEAELRYFTEVDGDDHYALVAVQQNAQDREGEVVGVARYIRLEPQEDTAEIAVTVVDTHQRRGIGRLLLERLLLAAYQRGIRRVRVHLLAENLPVRKLLQDLLGTHVLEQEEGILSGELPLDAQVTKIGGATRAPLFELLRLAAEEAVLPISLGFISTRAQLSALKSRLASRSSGGRIGAD